MNEAHAAADAATPGTGGLVQWHPCHDLEDVLADDVEGGAACRRAWEAADTGMPLPTQDSGVFSPLSPSEAVAVTAGTSCGKTTDAHDWSAAGDVFREVAVDGSLEEVWQRTSAGGGRFLAVRARRSPHALLVLVGASWAFVDSKSACYALGRVSDAPGPAGGLLLLGPPRRSLGDGSGDDEGAREQTFTLTGAPSDWLVLPESTMRAPQSLWVAKGVTTVDYTV